MNLKLTTRHFEITDALRNHAEKKISKFKHYFDAIVDLDLIMEKENTEFKTSITFDVDKKRFHIETKDHDMYDAVDKLMDKVERKIRRHREKISSHHKRKSVSEASSMVESDEL